MSGFDQENSQNNIDLASCWKTPEHGKICPFFISWIRARFLNCSNVYNSWIFCCTLYQYSCLLPRCSVFYPVTFTISREWVNFQSTRDSFVFCIPHYLRFARSNSMKHCRWWIQVQIWASSTRYEILENLWPASQGARSWSTGSRKLLKVCQTASCKFNLTVNLDFLSWTVSWFY